MDKTIYWFMGGTYLMNIKYKFLMWFYKGNTQKEIDIILKYDPLNLLG